MLEPPWLGISNTHNLCFVSKVRKIGIPPANSSFSIYRQGFFSGVSGAEIRPHSQWKLGDFFPNLEKKIPNHS